MLTERIIAKPFGPYLRGDKVQFDPEDEKRFRDYLVPAPAREAAPAADEKLPPEDKKAPVGKKK